MGIWVGSLSESCHFRRIYTPAVVLTRGARRRARWRELHPCCFVIVGGLGGATFFDAHQEVRAFITEPVLQQRLAKYLVLQCFRNSTTLRFSRGPFPSVGLRDYSDVTVSSQFGCHSLAESVAIERRRNEAADDRRR